MCRRAFRTPGSRSHCNSSFFLRKCDKKYYTLLCHNRNQVSSFCLTSLKVKGLKNMENKVSVKKTFNAPKGQPFTHRKFKLFNTSTAANLTYMTNDSTSTVQYDHMFINIHMSLTTNPQASSQHDVCWQEDKNLMLTHLKVICTVCY